jgi:hypothetical protein
LPNPAWTAARRRSWRQYEPERGPRPERGYIGIRNHDDDSKGKANVYFKEVGVRPL